MITYKLLHINGLHFELLDDEGKGREYDVSFVDSNTTIYETNKFVIHKNILAKHKAF